MGNGVRGVSVSWSWASVGADENVLEGQQGDSVGTGTCCQA